MDNAVMVREAHVAYLIGLGDDALILGQRLSEWCGHAPSVEVDLSLANLGLDLIGQGTLLLAHAAEIENGGRDADALAFHRDELDFRNCLLVEQPNGDFARTMARQFFFSTFQNLLYGALTASSDSELAAIAAKAVKETEYHAGLAREWVVRLGDGTEESRLRMIDGLEWNWRFIDELFVNDAVDEAMIETRIGIDRAKLREPFDLIVAQSLAEATLDLPAQHRPVTGGRQGKHSEHLGHLLAVMQHIPRSFPDARW
ncbi:ring-1,2-phenylacetyl-CoA epoxidase subunit PaaC [Sphingobium sp. AP50]|jgi:ring-1,2-phenylacetyl-CoA epoxidase subunit PaaC|uniref:1,2-phenylacetyl-CoA epoxidase subunit PaaC n=1 Tax=Sphingobium sp. AP50 TaxID=1884369 RepID=UPI0008C4557D|nr:1,2-phenylacetyl-CoA epoxidase subunit PaaC [Sphingobium sp. AP50]SEJ47510.1 ring-1,2-phenylacetyl-CoA epoxidase subunit PaaC [Sphingobium sp. AP50]